MACYIVDNDFNNYNQFGLYEFYKLGDELDTPSVCDDVSRLLLLHNRSNYENKLREAYRNAKKNKKTKKRAVLKEFAKEIFTKSIESNSDYYIKSISVDRVIKLAFRNITENPHNLARLNSIVANFNVDETICKISHDGFKYNISISTNNEIKMNITTPGSNGGKDTFRTYYFYI